MHVILTETCQTESLYEAAHKLFVKGACAAAPLVRHLSTMTAQSSLPHSSSNRCDKVHLLSVMPVAVSQHCHLHCNLCHYDAAGAGKTTLLNNVLTNQAHQRVAVLVNDMAALNIDQRLVAENVVQQSGQELVALSNGCICCTIRDDLVREIRALAAQQVGAWGWHFVLPE